MLLTDRLRTIGNEAKRIRESLTFTNPRGADFDSSYGIGRGERSVRGQGPQWDALVAECAELMRDVYTGKRPGWHLKEAMTTSDFPNLFGDLLYRQLLGNYMPYPVSYPNYMRIVETNDFRKLHLYTLDGATAALTDPIKERAPYPEVKFVEGANTVQVAKYGRRYGITFEMVVNDDLNAFAQRPLLMAQGARRGEEYLATKLLTAGNGPDPNFFKAGNNNVITGNPVLSIAALQTGFGVLSAQLDAEGSPIVIQAATLVVPPALSIVAENILNAIQIRIAESGGTANQLMYVNNWMKSRLTLAVNPYLPILDPVKGNTAWYLVADPNDLNGRPAFVFAFLRGYRQPQLFVKDPDARLIGGGASDALEGDFDSDSIDYKLRHMFGGTQVDPKMAAASAGG